VEEDKVLKKVDYL